jgi:hypothetical protein
MGKVLRQLVNKCESFEEVRNIINKTYGTDYGYQGIRSAAYRQGITMANRDEAVVRDYEIRQKYGPVKDGEIPVYRVEDNRQWVPILLFGDLHIGHDNFMEDKLDVYLDYAKEEGMYSIGNGDLLETSLPHHIPQAMWDQTISPREQVRYLTNKIQCISDKIIMINPGNHENRISNVTSLCPLEPIADKFGCLYMKHGGLINVRAGNQSYLLLIKHGKSFSKEYRTEIRQYAELYPQADVIALGHVHVCTSFDINEHFLVEEDSLEVGSNGSFSQMTRRPTYQVGIRTGHALAYGGYVETKPFKPNRADFPILWINTMEHSTFVDDTGRFVVPN